MKKKLPVITLAEREEAARLEGLPGEVTLALADIAATMRDGLMAMSCSAGLLVVAEIMQAEIASMAGQKGRHDPERTVTRNGTARGSVALGGRTVAVRRPRAVHTDGSGEVVLDSYTLLSSQDLLSQLVVERMLAGVATRRHVLVADPVGEALESGAKATSKSAVSRRFVKATEVKLAELLSRDLSQIDVAVVMIDGVIFCGRCCVVALIITTDGTKNPGRTLRRRHGEHRGRDRTPGRPGAAWTALRARDPLCDRRVQGPSCRGAKSLRRQSSCAKVRSA
jgi:putative transposase